MPSPPRRWPRVVGAVLGSLVLGLALVLGGAWWWSGTEGSLAAAIAWAGRTQPLAVEQVSGALRKGGHVGHLTWRDPQGLSVDARDILLTWQPLSLLSGRLTLEQFSAASITVDDRRPRTSPSAPPASLSLPLAIALKEFNIAKVHWTGPPAFTAEDVRGGYAYTGTAHQLALGNAKVAGGMYQGKVSVGATGDMAMEASLTGQVQAGLPGTSTTLPLAFTASAQGPLAQLQVRAALRIDQAAGGSLRPEASATALVTPWRDPPLPEAEARFRDLDTAMLWPQAPRTQLTGSASVRPAGTEAWRITAALSNARAGPWDQRYLPLERLEAAGEWRGGKALLRSLDARAAGGRVQASGEWSNTATAPGAGPSGAGGWKVEATLQQVNPAAVHSRLAAQAVSGKATVRSEGDDIAFDTRLDAGPALAGQANTLAALRLRDALARGVWRPLQAGGTLELAALKIRTSDAELNAAGQFQPQAQGGRGQLTLSAPGLQASAEGEARRASGAGQLELMAGDASQAARWLRTLPGAGTALGNVSAQGRGALRLGWQGGWQDPVLNARLDLPVLDWTVAPDAARSASPAAAGDAAAPQPMKLRALQASLSGRLGQAQLAVRGGLDFGT
ncbi:MAG: hypothetical protein JWQ72_1260, partial [Polaromonas sp.]|nr:hypothetical protein [Polaromonas sp.]